MTTIPTTQILRAVARQPQAEQDKAVESWRVKHYSLQQLDDLEFQINPLNDSDFKKRIVSSIALRRRHLNRPAVEQRLQEIRQNKRQLKRYKFNIIMAIFAMLGFIFSISGNKQTETKPFDNSTISTERQFWSTYTFVKFGIVGLGIIAFCLLTFSSIEVCGVKWEGYIAKQYHELKKEEAELKAVQ